MSAVVIFNLYLNYLSVYPILKERKKILVLASDLSYGKYMCPGSQQSSSHPILRNKIYIETC